MQTNSAGETSAGARELLTGVEFLAMLRQVVEFRPQATVADPLQSAVDQIASNPAFSESRLLMRILVALSSGEGQFRRAEIAALDAKTLALVIVLMDLHAAGTWPAGRWARAVEEAQAASA